MNTEGTTPIAKLDAPSDFRNSCRKVDSITIGNPSPQKNSTRETAHTLRLK